MKKFERKNLEKTFSWKLGIELGIFELLVNVLIDEANQTIDIRYFFNSYNGTS